MPQRAFACIAVLVPVLAAPAGAHAADVVRPSSVGQRATLGPGTHTLTLACPTPSVALSAAVTRKSNGVDVRRSIPGRNARDWRFHVAVGARSAGRVTTVLRCVRLDLPAGVSGARLQVRTIRVARARVPADGTRAVRAHCGPGWIGTGYGFDAGTSGNVRLAEVVPVSDGWEFDLENVGGAATRARISARCLRRTVSSADGSELRFRVTRPAREHTLGNSGTPRISRGCGPRRFSLATGSIVDSGDTIELATSGPTRPAWGSWTFDRASGGEQVRTYLVCLSRRSAFR